MDLRRISGFRQKVNQPYQFYLASMTVILYIKNALLVVVVVGVM